MKKHAGLPIISRMISATQQLRWPLREGSIDLDFGRYKAARSGKKISKQIRDLVFQMVVEIPTWGARCIRREIVRSATLKPSKEFTMDAKSAQHSLHN